MTSNSNKMTMKWYIGLGMLALMALLQGHSAEAKSYLKTNEVTNNEDPETPMCTADSVCGFMQANTRGISSKLLCGCPNDMQCPMNWDADDGHTISQDNDQYKFCGKAPSLKVCTITKAAYTARLVYSRITGRLYSRTELMHCICPADHQYLPAIRTFDNPDAISEAVDLTYTCIPLPICGIGDTCKIVSEKGYEFLVNRKCHCPSGSYCRTLGNSQGSFFDQPYGRRNMLRCQQN